MKTFHLYLRGAFVKSVKLNSYEEAKKLYFGYVIKDAKRGRPKLNSWRKMTNRGVRMLPTQWAKFDLLGGAKWLRNEVDKANTDLGKVEVKDE